MELTKFGIRVLLKYYWKEDYKADAVAWKICEVEENVSLGSVWNNDASNVSTLEKETLNIYHILEELYYGTLRIYVEVWKKIRKKYSLPVRRD